MQRVECVPDLWEHIYGNLWEIIQMIYGIISPQITSNNLQEHIRTLQMVYGNISEHFKWFMGTYQNT